MTTRDNNSTIDYVLEQASFYRPDLNNELADPLLRAILIQVYQNAGILDQFSENLVEVAPQASRSLTNRVFKLLTLAIMIAGGIHVGKITLVDGVDIREIISIENLRNIDIDIFDIDININAEEIPEEKQSPNPDSPTFDPIYFDSGESHIRDSEVNKIPLVAHYLTNNPDRKVTLTGYTDRNPGTGDKDDKPLSSSRIEEVANLLIEHGVKESQIERIPKGYNHPGISENREENEALSRRVTIEIK